MRRRSGRSHAVISRRSGAANALNTTKESEMKLGEHLVSTVNGDLGIFLSTKAGVKELLFEDLEDLKLTKLALSGANDEPEGRAPATVLA